MPDQPAPPTTPAGPNSNGQADGLLPAGTPAVLVEAAGLGREVERLSRRLSKAEDAHSRGLDELRTMVTDLATALTQLAETTRGAQTGREDAPPTWLEITDPGEANQLLHQLAGWVGHAYIRLARPLPACWLWHPDLVTALGWLHASYTDATTGPKANAGRALDWLDRHLPAVERLADRHATCDIERHTEHGDLNQPGQPAAPLTSATAMVADWWTTHRHEPPPAPTPDMVAEADQHGWSTRR